MKRLLLSLLFLTLSAYNMSSAKSIEECAKIYHATVNSALIDSPSKLAEYLQHNGQGCMQYDEYNVWLVSVYQDAGEYTVSVDIAKKALENASEYKPNLLQFIAEAELQSGHDDEAFKQAEKIAHDYPKYSPIYGMLGEIVAKKGNWNAALEYSEKGYKISKEVVFLLASAGDLHQLDRHEEAVDALYKALELEPQSIKKTAGMLTGIISLANLKRYAEAAALARRHIAANPNWRGNQQFVQAAKALGVAN